jgi:hypothetical protein
MFLKGNSAGRTVTTATCSLGLEPLSKSRGCGIGIVIQEVRGIRATNMTRQEPVHGRDNGASGYLHFGHCLFHGTINNLGWFQRDGIDQHSRVACQSKDKGMTDRSAFKFRCKKKNN